MTTDLQKLNDQFKGKETTSVLKWAIDTFHPAITLASSFGAEDVVLIDMLVKLEPAISVFTLDTGRLNPETYEIMERVREHYKIDLKSYFPERQVVEKLENTKGFYSFRESVENRKECCHIRKVEPLNRALKGMKAWITGIRSDQAATRAAMEKIEIDEAHGGIIKINPLLEWNKSDVWSYIRKNKVPTNTLHDLGYPSIGCAPCTRAVKEGEDDRAGRWWWENAENKECGLHR